MDLGLKSKICIITGGSDGIGKAAAISLSNEGAKVAIIGRNEKKLNDAVNEIISITSGEVIGISADVSNENNVKGMVNSVVNKWGGIDILINNAGTSSATSLENITDEQIKIDFGIKVYGAIYCARNSLEYLKKSDSGVIINTTTPGGKASGPSGQPTSLSRAAGISLTKSWAGELAKYNIRVNTICVGLLKSGQHRSRWKTANKENPEYTIENHWEKLGQNVPLGNRVGEAHEAGDVICFLASNKASYVTGTAINVDGGTSPVI